jgi:hypothetical protein
MLKNYLKTNLNASGFPLASVGEVKWSAGAHRIRPFFLREGKGNFGKFG